MKSSIYPQPLRTILKCGPVIVIYSIFSSLFCTCIYDIIYHPHDRIEKSSKFERIVRKQDEKLRYYYKPNIEWQPNNTGMRTVMELNRPI